VSATFEIKPALRAGVAIVALVVALVLPTQALATNNCGSAGSDPTAAQYCTSTDVPVSNVSSPVHGEATAASTGGSLPFTGTDLLALAAIACAFVAIGLALQRLSAGKADTH